MTAGAGRSGVTARRLVVRDGMAFLLNGIAATVWLPRVPDLPGRLDTTAGRLGWAFAVTGIGGVVGSRLAPRFLRGRSPARVMAVAGFAVALFLVLRAVPGGLAGFLVVQAFVGVTDGVHDVAMNAEGVRLDAASGRSIMNRLHGVWSVGALLGAFLGSALAGLGVGFAAHVAIGAALILALNVPLLAAFREPPNVMEPAAPAPHGSRVTLAMVVLGVVGIAAALGEAAPNDWGAIYLRDRLGTSEGVAGLATVAFAAAMVLARFTGDHLVERFSAMHVLFTGSLVAAAGLGLGLGVDRPWSVIAGWALVGAGIATAFPALFVAGSKLPGIAPEVGMGAITSVARFGFLVGPIAIGSLVDSSGVRAGLLVALVAMGLMAGGSLWLMRQAGVTTTSM